MATRIKIDALPEWVERCYNSQNNLMVISSPGMGKTTVLKGMEQMEREDGVHYKVFQMTGSSLSEDAINGIPYKDDKGMVVYSEPEWLHEMRAWTDADPLNRCILFMDEFNTADGYVLKTMLTILSERCVPTQKDPLPERTVMVAAMNPADQNDGSEIIRPLLSRFMTVEIQGGRDEYARWLRGYVDEHPEMFKGLSGEQAEAMVKSVPEERWCAVSLDGRAEVNPRSLMNTLKMMCLCDTYQDRMRVSLAGLGILLEDATPREQTVDTDAPKKKKTRWLSRQEMEQMSLEEVKNYKLMLDGIENHTMALLSAKVDVQNVILEKEEKEKSDENENN